MRCIVCDGAPSNISTLELLGAKIPDAPYFSSTDGSRIYTALDAAHMVKLARNSFGGPGLKNRADEVISWHYITELYKLQRQEGCT